ncbi:MAG: hypothetical protein HY020_23255 [Burkholderiales bacterium]|nr:hypothetical protein [Burkholderiales bacterium]
MGKLRETCPILLAMTPHEMVTAVHADRVLLGRILFPILARAWRANRAIHREAPRWPRPAAAALGVGFVGWPDVALANKLKHVDDAGIWAFRMYVDRAASWRYPDTTSPERSCVERVLEALHGKSVVPELITHLMRDHAVFSAAQAVDKRAAALAMKAGTTALPRLVPVLNWIYAGWGIYNSISEFAESEKRHYCTLDPQDCLATEAPDIASLLVDIELQVAFALI